MRTVMPGSVAEFEFTVSNKNGGRADFSGTLEAADFKIFRRGSTTARSSVAGLNAAAVLGSTVGLYRGSLDVGDNTDADFYANGNVIQVVLSPDTETADGEAVTEIVFECVIGGEVSPDRPVIGVARADSTASRVQLPTTAASTNGAYKGSILTVRHASGAIESRCQGTTAYLGADRYWYPDTPFDTAVAAGASIWLTILPPAPANNVPSVQLSLSQRQAVAQDVLKACYMITGNKIEIDGAELVLYDTNGTTELGRALFTRLPLPANPMLSVGG